MGAMGGYSIGHFLWWNGDGYNEIAHFFFNHIPGFNESIFLDIQKQYEHYGFIADKYIYVHKNKKNELQLTNFSSNTGVCNTR